MSLDPVQSTLHTTYCAWSNRFKLLKSIYSESGWVAGKSVDVGGIFRARDAANRQILTSELRDFERQEWITLDERTSGITAVTLQPRGVECLKSMARQRDDIDERRNAARDALLRWLHSCEVTDQKTPGISAFSSSPYSLYYSSHFREEESREAATWLKERGYVKGIGPWQGYILRLRITVKGVSAVATKTSVNSGRISDVERRSEVPSAKMADMGRSRSPQTLSQILAGPISRFWAGGKGPTRSAIESAIQSAGIDPSTFQGSKEAVVRAALAGAKGQTAIDLVHDLIELLREDGCFEDPDAATATSVQRLRDAFTRVGCALSDEGTVASEGGEEFSTTSGNARSAHTTPKGPPEDMTTRAPSLGTDAAMTSVPTIFLVHGHDTALREKVEIQLRRWIHPVDVVILDQQASRGRTLVEKFEEHAGTATFAIVLATPDDEGRALDAPTLNPRARQNVVFEMGYLFAKLERDRVVVLNAGIEPPSDVAGIVYINPKLSNWRQQLARELDAAGIQGDWLR
jgi:predicted nucleotide-binding protein